MCIVTLTNVVMERVGYGEGVTWQGEILRCFCVYVRVFVTFTFCQTAGCKVQVSPGFGAACHLVNKQQLFVEEGGTDSCEIGGTWQMDVLFHMCK